ncbi:MAG: flagellar biosynthesis protein FlhB [Chthonomonadales bacterium]
MAADERTEAATPRKRQELRRQGRVSKSQDLVSMIVFVGVLLCIRWAGSNAAQRLVVFTRSSFLGLSAPSITPQTLPELASRATMLMLSVIGPVIAIALFLGVAANVLQTGVVLSGQPLVPDFTRINPLAGARRFLSGRGVVELAKSLAKIGVIAWLAYSTIAGGYADLLQCSRADVQTMLSVVGSLLFRVVLRISLLLLVLAALDYAYQRWSFERSIRMTRQEVREEVKNQEGNPQVKSRIRARMRQLARRRMMAEVPKADVVITNPTHYAVALRYDAQAMNAPQVVAKGAGAVAQKIRELAETNGVPIVENPPLARGLFKSVEIGQEIPSTFYAAVAEVLAFIYRLDSSRRRTSQR